ncbi:hypothetical protein ACTVCO_06850 [Sanguibacter sp. A247]|uniref:hypothetical protein n=1 Tax=unclassified Sanguibacter TaxID=2645534 RepID=UPI003FD8F0C4
MVTTRLPRASSGGESVLGGWSLARLLGALGIGTRVGPEPEPRGTLGTPAAPDAAPDAGWDAPLAGKGAHLAAKGARLAGRDAVLAARDALVDDMCVRAHRAGHTPATVGRLRDATRTLTRTELERVGAPLSVDAPQWRGERASQTDSTTCGAAVGAMLCAAGDPVLAYALETGVNLTRMPGANPTRPPATSEPLDARLVAASRGFVALQRHLHAATARRSLLALLPWPRALGTTPWGLAREVRWADVRYRGVVVDVDDAQGVRRLTRRIDAHLREGIPLPLWTGGSSATGWASAVPRHVVLLVDVAAVTVVGARQDSRADLDDGPGGDRLPAQPGENPHWRVYEPASGRVLTVAAATWAQPERRDAWGRWSRPHWILLPR